MRNSRGSAAGFGCWRHAMSLLVLLASATVGAAATADAPASDMPDSAPHKHVLILNSYHRGYPWSDNVTQGIEDVLSPMLDIETYTEYMDAKRLSGPEHLQALVETYQCKFANVKFDAIVLSDNDAFDFIREHRAKLFPGVPVVFCGVNEFKDSVLAGQEPMTGVIEDIDYEATYDVALRLCPTAKRVVVISDGTATGLAHERAARGLAPHLEGRATFEDLSLANMDMGSVLARLRGLGPDSVVLLLSHARDVSGKAFAPLESTKWVCQASGAPVFVVTDWRLGHGPVGGKVVSGYYQGKVAAEMAVRILGGESAAAIPVLKKSPNVFMFDYRVLGRWDIPESRLPEGSIVLNRPTTFYVMHKGLIFGTIGTVALLTAVIAVLLANTVRRRKAEKALRQSESRYRNLFDNLRDAAFLARVDTGVILEANQQAAVLMGCRREDLVGRHQSELNPPDRAEVSRQRFMEHARGDVAAELLSEVLRRDGTRVPVAIGTSTFLLGDQKCILGLFRDLTDLRRAEEARRAEEQKYRTIVENINDSFIIHDFGGHILDVNENTCRLFGYTRDELIGADLAKIDSPAEQERMPARLQELVRSGVLVFDGEQIRKDGATVFVNVSAKVVSRDGQGVVQSFIRDITERKRFEMQLRQSQKMEAIGRLAGGIAHDFRNQLTVIQGYADLLLSGGLVLGEGREMLQEVLKASARSAQLTGQLLAFSRKQMLQPRVTDLAGLIADIAKSLPRLVGEDVRVSVAATGSQCRACLDLNQFQQAIFNLAVNARQAMPKGGALTIETAPAELDDEFVRRHPDTKPGPYVVVSVADTGCGMDAATREHIFEPFFTTKGVGEGTGLGLSMVYGFVKQSGGSIEVASKPGMGSTFRLYFPRVEPEAEPAPPPAAPPAALRGDETLLVIEDEPSVRRLLATFLRDAGYKVLDTGHADEALPLAEKYAGGIDMLVTDVVMPGTSGVDLALRVRQARPGIPVLFISGYGGRDLAQRGMNETRGELLVKPFSRDELMRSVRRMLDARRQPPPDALRAPGGPQGVPP